MMLKMGYTVTAERLFPRLTEIMTRKGRRVHAIITARGGTDIVSGQTFVVGIMIQQRTMVLITLTISNGNPLVS